MKKLLLIIILLLANSINGQLKVKNILNENFDNNKNSWTLDDDDDYLSKIKDGKLYFNNKSSESKWSHIETDINFNKDFFIETSIKLVSGTDDLLSIIINKNEDNFDEFGFSNDGYWKYTKLLDDEYLESTGWQKINYIKEGEFNKLAILKLNEDVFFLINDKPVLLKKNMSLTYKDIAISICEKAEVEADFVKIGYFNASQSEKKLYSDELKNQLIAAKKEDKNVIIENTLTKELNTSFEDNNTFDFTLGESEEYSFKINNNTLELENKLESYYFQTQSGIQIDVNHDFELSSSLKWISGTNDEAISLIIKDEEFSLQFAYAQNGHWFSEITGNKESIIFTEWQKTSIVKEVGYNSLKIKKIGNNIYFILNNKVLNKVKIEDVGNNIYIRIDGKSKILVDNLKLTQSYNSTKVQENLIAKYDELWADAKKENIGAFNKVTIRKPPERYDAEKTRSQKRFIKKQDKKIENYRNTFKNATKAEVIKKLGQPYKSDPNSISYKWQDYYDGRKQELVFWLFTDTYKKVTFQRVNSVSVYLVK